MSDSAYYVAPPDARGPGLLLLHSWWGLSAFFKQLADRFADEGYAVLAPDLNFGEVFDDRDRAETHLLEAEPDRLARLTLSSAKLLQEKSLDPTRPIAVVGFSMGASLGLWASARIPETIGAVVAFYGTQSIDFAGSRAAYQLHLAEFDPIVSAEEAAFMEATLGLERLSVESFVYPGTEHWFFEEDRPEYRPAQAGLAWDRTLAFLGTSLPPGVSDV
jgi:carboxymethylenebutenolidase